MKRVELSKILFVASAAVMLISYGFAVGRYQIFPYSYIKYGLDAVALVFDERAMIARTKPVSHLFKAREAGNGVLHVDERQMAPGLTFISGFFDGGLELRLMRPDGSVVHRWRPRFSEVFPNPSHIQPREWVPQSEWNTEIHGAMAFPDGSVLFNFEQKGLAKLDRCGVVQWTVPRMTHHSVDTARDGGFWVPGVRYVDKVSPFPMLTPPFKEDTILKISSTGTVEMEMSILALLFDNNLQSLLFANGPNGSKLEREDHAHLNDIEELTPAMARHFPQFAAGDLLVSLRNMNLLFVLNPTTRKIKWHQMGPWMDQHDPDFLANGKISVFSNNNDRTDDGSVMGGSTIVEVDPKNGDVNVRYGGAPNQRMFTSMRGKHQSLDNGNLLIVEPHAGRVFEVNRTGQIVWKYINRYDADDVALVVDAVRYGPDYFNVSNWKCERK